MRALLLLALLAGCGKPHEPVRVIAQERPAPVATAASQARLPAPAPKPAAPAPHNPPPERSPLLIPAESDLPHSETGNDALRAAVESRLERMRK